MSIASEITRLQTAKADIKSAIEEKGVSVPSSASISTYDDYVLQIQTGGGGGSEDLKQLIQRTITSIDIPSGTTSIGGYAFNGCSGLTSVTIPNSVTSIGNYAFYYCSGLTEVTIPSGVTNIGQFAFYGCSGLTSVTIPNSVTSIGAGAFYYCSDLTEVTIGSGVTSIGNSAFNNCTSLTSITIPDNVTSIGSNAFNYCSGLTEVTIPSGITSIGQSVFASCSSLSSITIPSSVTSIGDSAFNGCSSLSSVTIPNSVTSIGGYAFQNCGGLTSVTIPDSVTNIGNYAFRDCSGLTSVTIGSGVTSIGNSVFENCSGLTEVTVEATTPPTLGSRAFNSSVQVIYVPCESVSAYKAASRWSTYASIIQCEAQYRTTSGTPYCQGYDKYVDVYSQVSNDGGVTWTTTATTPTLEEVDSQYCGYEPTPTCETPENLETFALDDDFDTTKEVWNLWPDNLADLDGDEMTEEEEYYFTGYVVLSEDGQSRDYTIVASITEGSGWTVDICEYDENGENFAGNVLTALTEDVWIGMCDYFEKPMYVMDFSQYLVGEWSEMDDNTFDLTSQIYKVKMNAQDLYYTYSIDTFSGEWGFNDSVDGMGTAYELGYNVELVDDHLEASIDIYENYVPVTSYTFSDLSSEEVIIDLDAIFGKPLYADDCNMKCVDGDDENCSLYAPLWNAFVSDGTKFNEFEVETEMEE